MTLPPNCDNRIVTALFAANLARATDIEEPSDWNSESPGPKKYRNSLGGKGSASKT